MDTPSEKLTAWLDAARDYTPTDWERLPELELYMDQVITLMDRQLVPFTLGEEKLLTPSMINNYVKDGVLPRPVRKKYSREHLGRLMMICLLKQAISLPEIRSVLEGLADGEPPPEMEAVYADFSERQSRALRDAAAAVEVADCQSREDWLRTAMTLALEANARRIAAARIIDALSGDPEETE